jgi:hypothetical protein
LSWTSSAKFGNDANFLRTAQGCVRATYALGRKKIAFVDRIPFLFARLDEPGISQRCRDQWAEAIPEHHDLVSAEFLSPTSSWFSALCAIRPDGHIPSQALQNEVNEFKLCPMDDTAGERPHAVANHHVSHNRSSSWGWIASTCRLEQNFTDLDLLADAGADLETEWQRYSSLLQVSEAKSRRPCRLSRAQVEGRVYGMSHLCNKEMFGVGEDASSSDMGAAPAAIAGESISQPGCLDQDDAIDHALGVLGDSGSDDEPDVDSQEVKLMREFLARSLDRYDYISVNQHSTDDADIPFLEVFQLLDIERKDILARTYLDHVPNLGYYQVSAQPLEQWRPWAEEGLPTELNVFVVEEPSKVDILKLLGVHRNNRALMRKWKQQPSDIDGCVSLVDPQPIEPTMALSDAGIPTLSLLDALLSQGFVGKPHVVVHSAASHLKEFDERNPYSGNPYFKCVLARDNIFSRGTTSFRSDAVQSYYWLMLKSGAVEPGLSSKNYKDMLKAVTGPAHVALALQARPAAALHAEPECLAVLDEDEVDGDDGIVYPAIEPNIDGDPGLGLDGVANPAIEADDVDGDDPIVPPYPTFIEGRHVSIERRYNEDDGSLFSEGLRVSCGCPLHGRHMRFRSTALDRLRFGPRGAEFWLGAWLVAGERMSAEDHARYRPNQQAVQEYADAHP